ncbi:hypothetical protein Tco_1346398 [Tanacetum coccineum]
MWRLLVGALCWRAGMGLFSGIVLLWGFGGNERRGGGGLGRRWWGVFGHGMWCEVDGVQKWGGGGLWIWGGEVVEGVDEGGGGVWMGGEVVGGLVSVEADCECWSGVGAAFGGWHEYLRGERGSLAVLAGVKMAWGGFGCLLRWREGSFMRDRRCGFVLCVRCGGCGLGCLGGVKLEVGVGVGCELWKSMGWGACRMEVEVVMVGGSNWSVAWTVSWRGHKVGGKRDGGSSGGVSCSASGLCFLGGVFGGDDGYGWVGGARLAGDGGGEVRGGGVVGEVVGIGKGGFGGCLRAGCDGEDEVNLRGVNDGNVVANLMKRKGFTRLELDLLHNQQLSVSVSKVPSSPPGTFHKSPLLK